MRMLRTAQDFFFASMVVGANFAHFLHCRSLDRKSVEEPFNECIGEWVLKNSIWLSGFCDRTLGE